MAKSARDESVWSGAPGDRMLASLNRNMGAVIPLFSREGPEMLAPRGCAVLFTLKQQLFLLSAAHVFDDLEHSAIWTTGALNLQHPLRLKGEIVRNVVPKPPLPVNTLLSRRPRDGDRIDCGVMRIESSVPSALASEALRLSDFDVTMREPGANVLAIVGWPANRTRVNPRQQQIVIRFIRYAAWECGPEDYTTLDRTPRDHALVRWNANDMWRLESGLTDPPNLEGVSGSGMWRMDSYRNPLIVGQRDKLLAVFTGRLGKRSGALVGTRVHHHLRAISHQWPEFRSEIGSPMYGTDRTRDFST